MKARSGALLAALALGAAGCPTGFSPEDIVDEETRAHLYHCCPGLKSSTPVCLVRYQSADFLSLSCDLVQSAHFCEIALYPGPATSPLCTGAGQPDFSYRRTFDFSKPVDFSIPRDLARPVDFAVALPDLWSPPPSDLSSPPLVDAAARD